MVPVPGLIHGAEKRGVAWGHGKPITSVTRHRLPLAVASVPEGPAAGLANSADQRQYLRVYVAALRRKLGDACRIITESGIGYRLTG